VKILDTYTLRARYTPVLVVLLPALALLGGAVASTAQNSTIAGAASLAIGGVAAQLGRSRGKALEPGLWDEWGGSPTLSRLRYRTAAYPDRVQRLHEKVERVLNERLPTADEEERHPNVTDDRYNEAVQSIIGLTRNRQTYPLLFAENINYGLRRNLLGLKPAGIAVSLLTVAVAGVLFALEPGTPGHRVALYAPAAGLAAATLAFWLASVSRVWVKLPAEAYADRLYEAVNTLSRSDATTPA
jgi:hypothetical protein